MTEEKIEIMQAYVDGRDIEFRSKKNIRGEWSEIPSGRNPHWNWEVFDYRLKPKHQPSKHQPSTVEAHL